jgi:hypothetical protein
MLSVDPFMTLGPSRVRTFPVFGETTELIASKSHFGTSIAQDSGKKVGNNPNARSGKFNSSGVGHQQ